MKTVGLVFSVAACAWLLYDRIGQSWPRIRISTYDTNLAMQGFVTMVVVTNRSPIRKIHVQTLAVGTRDSQFALRTDFWLEAGETIEEPWSPSPPFEDAPIFIEATGGRVYPLWTRWWRIRRWERGRAADG